EALPFELTPARVRRICAAHFGCQADGLLLLSRSDDERFEARLRIFNPDGSEAELSGNGAREAVLYLRKAGWTDRDRFSIETAADRAQRAVPEPHQRRVHPDRGSDGSSAYIRARGGGDAVVRHRRLRLGGHGRAPGGVEPRECATGRRRARGRG